MGAPKKLADEVRDLAKGFRWGRRPVVPRSAEQHVRPTQERGFPTAWARTPAAGVAREVILRFGLRTVVWNETAVRVYGQIGRAHV